MVEESNKPVVKRKRKHKDDDENKVHLIFLNDLKHVLAKNSPRNSKGNGKMGSSSG